MTEPETPKPSDAFSKEELKRAYKAFKRRLKLTRLDDESKLGGGPMSGGGKSRITAVTPPNQYPQEIWDELVARGRLRCIGQGLYEPTYE